MRIISAAGSLAIALAVSVAAFAQAPEVSGSDHGHSDKVKNMPVGGYTNEYRKEKPLRLPHGILATQNQPDGAQQKSVLPNAAVTSGASFPGVGEGDYGYSPDSAPPDTNGAVGANQYVQWVNESFAVFDKAGHLISGPVEGNQLFKDLGPAHPCAVNNDGDPIAQYDKAAGRWVMTQFSVTNGSSQGFYQCVAVSDTSDATGAYSVYAFKEPNFNDYPKLGVWPDAYYVTFNIFSGNSFVGSRACALNRSAMLAGQPATQVCFQESSSVASLLPSDLDGMIAPPAGAPNFLLTYSSSALKLYKFHVDFTKTSNSTFTGPTSLSVSSFTPACNGGTCIPQPGTKQQLDSLADRLMYRLAYRHFADGHEALVVNHSVATSTAASGIRWYEIRNPSTTPVVYQQGTFSPDSTSRWMGSITMDKVGNIIVGYSASSSSVHPSIRYTVHTSADALGAMESENTIIAGSGSQQKRLNRWGDYSAMTVDPGDDCTVFYTNEYLKTDGTFNWSTWVSSFKLPSCH
ncbi:MAG TPA: hypothetical protein VH351_07685 [Bryobacteraceae bacterium]|jgi:hypothetical protein|nr:hypothetical protein [Bryobacteraceae bacterium]